MSIVLIVLIVFLYIFIGSFILCVMKSEPLTIDDLMDNDYISAIIFWPSILCILLLLLLLCGICMLASIIVNYVKTFFKEEEK